MTPVKSTLIGLVVCVVVFGRANAAELPNQKAGPPPDHAKVCNINGMAGFVLPGSDTCMRISGDVKMETIFANKSTGYVPGIVRTQP
jgi:Porin subfamily